MKSANKWYEVKNAERVVSPSLLVYPERIEHNIKLMIKLAGGTEHLRPHIKTHKMAELIEMQIRLGITKFKCATLAEVNLLADCGAKDILLAMQPVGPNVERFLKLVKQYPDLSISTLVDHASGMHTLSSLAAVERVKASVWLDINNGMNRTGISPGEEALRLYERMAFDSNLIVRGLHVYDGHIHDPDLTEREKRCDADFEPVTQLIDDITESGLPIEKIIAGGSPTFHIHARRKNVEVSPGTPLLWDQGYANLLSDLPFLPAGVLLTRVVSKPASHLICFDLGHKALAAEMDLPRVEFLGREKTKQVSQHEEHLVVETEETEKYELGEIGYAIPIHICPTVVRYKQVLVIENKEVSGHWKVAARDHDY